MLYKSLPRLFMIRITCKCKAFVANYDPKTNMYHVPQLRHGSWTCILPVSFKCKGSSCSRSGKTYLIASLEDETLDCEECGKILVRSMPGFPEAVQLSLDRISDVHVSDADVRCKTCGAIFKIRKQQHATQSEI